MKLLKEFALHHRLLSSNKRSEVRWSIASLPGKTVVLSNEVGFVFQLLSNDRMITARSGGFAEGVASCLRSVEARCVRHTWRTTRRVRVVQIPLKHLQHAAQKGAIFKFTH